MSNKNFEKLLRTIETQQYIYNDEKRLNVFKGKDIIENPTIIKKYTPEDIKREMELLLENGIITKAIISQNKRDCNFSLQKKFYPEDSFIWIKEGSQTMKLFISILCIIGCLFLAMYQLWPSSLRHYSVYIAYAMMAFLMFMFVLGIIRLIIFSITFFSHPPGIWLFPNLFADVGFVDSFIPLWSYHGVDTKPPKKDE